MSVGDVEEGLPMTEYSDATSVQLIYSGGKYTPSRQLRLRNDLLFIVGYLEFFNALDFPANVWNSIPIPTFAKGLMVTGGTLALLASTTAVWDFRKSYRNVLLLRQERAFLHRELEIAKSEKLRHRQIHLMAWLNHNFRELGWEVIDRLFMDAFIGFAAILVGTGTIMAIAGANHHIYKASNLLSGYVGNGFLAFYGLFNCMWSVYSFLRARKHKRIVRTRIRDESVRRRGVQVFRNHQEYALVDGLTMLVSSAGSLISSTMWWGYPILIPCIASSVYCNYLWRSKVGYTRILSQFKSSHELEPDVYQQIVDAIDTQSLIKTETLDTALSELHQRDLLQQIARYELFDHLCSGLTNDPTVAQAMGITSVKKSLWVNLQDVEILKLDILLKAVLTCFQTKIGFQHVLDRERMLFEYLGSYVTFEELLSQPERAPKVEAAEKSTITIVNQVEPLPTVSLPQHPEPESEKQEPIEERPS